MMSLKVAMVLLAVCGSQALARELAVCGPASGHAYYHSAQLVPKKAAGWKADSISGGSVTLTRLGPEEFDILFIDSTKRIISTRNDGGKVLMVRKGAADMTFLVLYPGKAVEFYSFFRNREGDAEYALLQSKGGDELPIHKSSVMVGRCSALSIPGD